MLTKAGSLIGTFSCISSTILAQATIFGTTLSSGPNPGSIYKIQMDGTGYEVLHEWDGIGDFPVEFSVLDAEEGTYIGTMADGGEYGGGHIFTYSRTNNFFEVLASFSPEIGASPTSGLLEVSPGLYYGLLAAGGTYNRGGLFKFDLTEQRITKLVDFREEQGSSPGAGLVRVGNYLYGTLKHNGAKGGGTIFQFNTENEQFTVVHDFEEAFRFPRGTLQDGGDGKLYGITGGGDPHEYGAIYSLDLATLEVALVYAFDLEYGGRPLDGLISLHDGNLIGVTYFGGANEDGVIYSYDIAASAYSVLFNFDLDDPDIGGNPGAFIIVDDKVYGNAGHRTGSYKLLYEFDLGTHDFRELFDFDDEKRFGHEFIIEQVASGQFFGMMHRAVFELDTETGELSELHNLTNYMGESPRGGLFFASDSLFYGVTSAGGLYGYGTIFSLDPETSEFHKIHDFDPAGFFTPAAGFIEGKDGYLVGATMKGGAHNNGTIYSYSLSDGELQVLYEFDEEFAYTKDYQLTLGENDRVFGIAENINADVDILFSFNLVSHDFEVLVEFSGENGAGSIGAPMYSKTFKKLYGAGTWGADGGGLLYSYDMSAHQFQIEIDFPQGGEATPSGTPVEFNNEIGLPLAHSNKRARALYCSFDPLTGENSTFHRFGEGSGRFTAFGDVLVATSYYRHNLEVWSLTGGVRVIKDFSGSLNGTGYVDFYNYRPSAVAMPAISFNEDESYFYELGEYFTDVEDSASEFSYKIDSITIAELIDTVIFSAGVAEIIPAPNRAGEGELFFTGTDRGGSRVSNSFTFSIQTVPDIPTLWLDSGKYGDERMQRVRITRNDADGGEVKYFRIDTVVNLLLFDPEGVEVVAGDLINADGDTVRLSYEVVEAGPTGLGVSAATEGAELAGEERFVSAFIEKAVLVAQANDAWRRAGEANPEFSISYSGFLYDDDVNDLDQLPHVSSYTDLNTDPGEYPLIASGGSDNNYIIDHVNGLLAIFGPTTGVKSEAQGLHIFPQPAKEVVTIDLAEGKKAYLARIIDVAGREVLSKMCGGSRCEVDLGRVPGGVYLLILESEGGSFIGSGKMLVE